MGPRLTLSKLHQSNLPMSKLHELLAVESNLKAQAEKTRSELMGTFEKKRHLFTEKVVTFQPNEEGKPPVTEEVLELQSTVSQELTWISPFITKALDVAYQVSEANTQARADVVLSDDTILLKNVPATSLLELEKRMKELHDFVLSIPTLDPAKGFKQDADRGAYKAREDVRTRTKKVKTPLVLYQATDKHPAQVQVIDEDIPIGQLKTQEWSGLITPSSKAQLIERVEEVTRGVKQARARANETEVDTKSLRIGDNIVSHVFEGYV